MVECFDTNFGYFLFRVLQPELQSIAKGTTFVEISTFALANIKLPIPPLAEQRSIVEAIRKDSRPIDEAITRAQREIDLIREYHTRLIVDVVTGKLDVRGVALPVLDKIEAKEDWEASEDAHVDEIEEIEGVDA
jgi:restriction endonuclease S subunit